jgi:integrase
VDKQPAHYKFLAVENWNSDYRSVNNLLLYLTRKTKSEGSKRLYLWHLYKFCQYAGKKPNELITLRRDRVENVVQEYADSLMPASPRYSNLAVAILKAFFSVNGFKRARALELETYHAPRRFRIRPEYIPTKSEIYGMADSACSLRDRAMILTMYSTGLRNSTLRAILFRDIAEELNRGNSNIMIPVYEQMKEADPGACKGGIPYYTFTCDEATQALRLYLKEREENFGNIEGAEPLFCSEYNQICKTDRKKKPLTPRQLQIIVKSAAKRSGMSQWEQVHPHCLRKSFETVLHSQLIDGSNMDVKVQEFLMGHILPGSQDTYFDSSKVEKMRILYSKLRFGRTTVENKFKVLKAAVARAFEDTDIDPEQVIEEYVKLKHTGTFDRLKHPQATAR